MKKKGLFIKGGYNGRTYYIWLSTIPPETGVMLLPYKTEDVRYYDKGTLRHWEYKKENEANRKSRELIKALN